MHSNAEIKKFTLDIVRKIGLYIGNLAKKFWHLFRGRVVETPTNYT
jgi:hypothetical protein